MLSRILEQDEYDYFSSNFKQAQAGNPEIMNQLIASAFNSKHINYLKTVLATRRIALTQIKEKAEGEKKRKGKKPNTQMADREEDAEEEK